MHHTLTWLLASATFGVTLAGTHALLSPDPAKAAGGPSAAPGLLPDASAGLAALEREVLALGQRLGRLEAAPPQVARIDPALLEAAALRALRAAGVSSPDEPAPAPVAERPGVDGLVADVLAASEVERAALWKALADEGRADEVLAALRARAEADPHDPEKQLELGQAYIARIAEVGNSPLAGSYAMQADAAFDRALAVDPEHHAARFHKAVALSFWPPVLGKQPAAIQQFELLAAQQARGTQRPHFAETHLLLGNLYQQTGQREKALAAWRTGAELFPDHAGLAQQLALAAAGN